MIIAPSTWDMMCARALIGLGAMAVFVIALASYTAGFKAGRRRG